MLGCLSASHTSPSRNVRYSIVRSVARNEPNDKMTHPSEVLFTLGDLAQAFQGKLPNVVFDDKKTAEPPSPSGFCLTEILERDALDDTFGSIGGLWR